MKREWPFTCRQRVSRHPHTGFEGGTRRGGDRRKFPIQHMMKQMYYLHIWYSKLYIACKINVTSGGLRKASSAGISD